MNVLVIDDDKVDRLTVRELLGDGCNVLEASSQSEARQQIETSSVDCILLDYLIPGTDTLSWLSELAAKPLPVIILTGEGSEHIAVTAMKQGAQDYLSKRNLTGELLIRTIVNAIDTAGLKQKLAQKQQALASMNEELRGKVSELQRATSDLQDSAEKLRIVADFTYAWEYWRDTSGRFIYNSPSCETLTGYTREEFIRDAQLFIAIIHPGDRERLLSHVLEEETGRGIHELEFRIIRRDGQERWVSHVCQPAHEANGRLLGCRASNRDISDQKRAEVALEAEKRRTEQALLVAQEASRTKDHFLAVLSHELRTPLTPVLAGLSVLSEDSALTKEARDYLEIVRRNVELEARLIDDLLDLNRISRGKMELVKRPQELRTIIDRALEVCRSDIEVKRLHFSFDYGAGPYYVNGDEARLQQIFWNLLKNAIKFTPAGGRIGVTCAPEEDYVAVSVRDSGIGIEPALFGTIFDAFAQAESAKARRFGGLGLGLAIAKALVELHGGTITARSEGKDQGSVFVVRLPKLSMAELARVIPGTGAGRDPTLPVRILLVEDHGDTADMISTILRRHGYQVQTAGDVASGLETAARGRFDLLVSDLGLPDGSGLDLLQELRASGDTIPAIALTGFGQTSDLEQSRAAGFVSHLIKPVEINRLLDTVARVALTERQN